jgi:hypothetical protein
MSLEDDWILDLAGHAHLEHVGALPTSQFLDVAYAVLGTFNNECLNRWADPLLEGNSNVYEATGLVHQGEIRLLERASLCCALALASSWLSDASGTAW